MIVYNKEKAIDRISEILNSEKPSRILVIRGNRSYEESGSKTLIEQQLLNFNYQTISGFKKYSTITDVRKTINFINKHKIDFIIGVGGGTIMDIAKTASLIKDEYNIEKYVKGEISTNGKKINSLLIPTTAGTGAEITPFSVVYINKIKNSFEHHLMMPDYVILAPELTFKLNKRVTAQTGCDALAQAIEGFWSIKATEESKQYSREAIKLILSNLYKAVNDPDPMSRKAMLMGAHLAGKSIAIAKTTAAHALSYPLTGHYNIPHGHAVMLSLPYLFLINGKANKNNIQNGATLNNVQETFQELLCLLNVKNAGEAREMLIALMKEIHLEVYLNQMDFPDININYLINNEINYQRLNNNPVKITKDIIHDVFNQIIN